MLSFSQNTALAPELPPVAPACSPVRFDPSKAGNAPVRYDDGTELVHDV